MKRLTRKVAREFYDIIALMTDEELDKLIDQVGELTETNCWWLEYRLREAIIDVATACLESSREESRNVFSDEGE